MKTCKHIKTVSIFAIYVSSFDALVALVAWISTMAAAASEKGKKKIACNLSTPCFIRKCYIKKFI